MSCGDRQATFARLRGVLDVWSTRSGRSERTAGVLESGIPAVDAALNGGLAQGMVTELVCGACSCGGQLLLGQLLGASRAAHQRAALIDVGSGFDPASHAPELHRHLVWVRCDDVQAGLQAADLVVRDANFGLVVLDLKAADARAVRRVPGTLWYRLQRTVEPMTLALLVISAAPVVPSAHLRLELTQAFTAAAFVREREELLGRLAPVVQRQRLRLMRESTAG